MQPPLIYHETVLRMLVYFHNTSTDFGSSDSHLKIRLKIHTYPVQSGQKGRSLEKILKADIILIRFDDDIKESVKVTNVQKCDFSQS